MKKLKEKLRAKLSKNGGFTLVEMLIVVAIIAILIAVSIPLVSNSLEKAKHATDAANERAAKAEIMIQYLADEDAIVDGSKEKIVEGTAYYYDAAKGGLTHTMPTAANDYGQHKEHAHLAIRIQSNGEVQMTWLKAGSGIDNNTFNNADLCSGKEVDHT